MNSLSPDKDHRSGRDRHLRGGKGRRERGEEGVWFACWYMRIFGVPDLRPRFVCRPDTAKNSTTMRLWTAADVEQDGTVGSVN